MNFSIQRYLIPGLAVCCGIAAIGIIPAVHLPRQESGLRDDSPRAIPDPGLDSLSEIPPSMSEVVSKHLFIPERKATGQNSFPDLVVKGVFLGTEKSVVFSLKSKPQANLRVWDGGVERALSQITDPRDPRQPIATFLREWDIKKIRFDGVDVQHFITGETETYAVDYTPVRKVKDDAERGYGQGLMPQGGDGAQTAARASNKAKTAGQFPRGTATTPVGQMADRISAMMKRMSPNQQKQFMQRLGQNTGDANQKNGKTSSSSAKKNSSAKSQTQKKK